MINLFLLLLPLLTFAGPRSIASLDETVMPSYNGCIHSLANAPTTPSYPKQYFQQVGGKEAFTLRCHLADGKENMRFAFVLEDSIKSLKLPIYYYQFKYANGDTESTDLPRNVVHFKNDTKDLYIQLVFSDVAVIHGPEKIPYLAKELMTSTTKIQTEYVKKYETWLKTKGEDKAIILTEATPEELELLNPCLDAKKLEVVKDYIQSKYMEKIPAYGTIVTDSQNYQALSEEAKNRYKKPWAEFEAAAAVDIEKNHPACEGIVAAGAGQAAFTKTFQKSKAPYEALQRYLFQ